METKKNPQADLEKSRGIFLQVGLILAIGLSIFALEYKTYEDSLMNLGELQVDIEEEVIPITQREQKPPPPPPPPPQEIINVVEDDVELEEELIIESTETDQSEEIEVIEVEEEETDEVLSFAVVENKPIFPGCEGEKDETARFNCFQMSLIKFVNKEFKYPDLARQMGIQGRVFVSFVIEKDGSISNVEVARGVDPLLDAEAVRVVKKLPKFQPAKQRGRAVRMSYTVPIAARLQ